MDVSSRDKEISSIEVGGSRGQGSRRYACRQREREERSSHDNICFSFPLGFKESHVTSKTNRAKLTRLRPAAPALAAGPEVSEAAVLDLESSLIALPDEVCEDALPLRGL